MKLRNKLILSCAALAAVATTAVSTTYAWYTSNQEVTAGTITANTESKGEDLLLISRTGIANSWSSSVDLSDIVINLEPVTKGTVKANADDEGTPGFVTWNADANAVSNNSAAGKYISFDLYFKSGNASDLTVNIKTFKLQNTTGATLPTKSALTTVGLGSVGENYSVDLLRALTMEMTEGNTWEGSSTSQDFLENEDEELDVASTAYQFNGAAANDSFAKEGYSYAYNAHEYYNEVKGLGKDKYTLNQDVTAENFATLKASLFVYNNGTYVAVAADAEFSSAANYYTKTAGTGAIVTTNDGTPAIREEIFDSTGVQVNKTSYAASGWAFTKKTGSGSPIADPTSGTTGVSVLKVHFDIYLDGWDKACFDGVQGQTISLDMVFSSKTTA